MYDTLLLILSDASMNSPWVKTEIANARSREDQQKRQMLFPITLVPFDLVKDWKLFDADRRIDSVREFPSTSSRTSPNGRITTSNRSHSTGCSGCGSHTGH